ncbi:Regulator of chromosome condensation 1/beta-lactamase-inhibitor protein II [Amanita muscaria]
MPYASLLSAGSNAQGQLGNGTTDDSHSFQRCSFFGCEPGTTPPGTTRILSVSGGANHTLTLLEIGDAYQLRTELWGCGSGLKGQLGPARRPPALPSGSTTMFRPIILPLEQYGLAGYTYKKVCVAWETTYLVLTSPGTGDVLVSMGADDFGDLGVGGYSERSSEKEKPFHIISFDHIQVDGFSLRSDMVVIADIAAGQHHVLVQLRASLADKTTQSFLVGWGTSRHGQLGGASSNNQRGQGQIFTSRPKLVRTADDIVGLALGTQHTVFLHQSMHISGIGSDRKGQLSGIESLSHVRCISCTWNGTYAIVNGNNGQWHVMSTGSNSHGQLGRTSPGAPGPVDFPEMVRAYNVKRIACGSEHVLSLLHAKSETEVWGWGWNEHGNLGLGTTEDVPTPVRICPREPGYNFNVADIWAGCGTSWLYATEY